MNKDLEVFYNDLDKIVYSTKEPPIKIESKLSKIDEKLKEYNKINDKIINNKLKKKNTLASKCNDDQFDEDDDYRRYNIYNPKIKINKTSKPITTFAFDKSDTKLINDEPSIEFKSQDNGLYVTDFVSKIVEKTHTNNQTVNFYHNKFFEYNYSDVGESQ